MIFAIDGAEDFGFGELGAYSSGVASLQTALIALGQKVGDSTLASLVLDGLIGPKTTAAANRAFTTFVSNGPNFASGGSMSQSQVASAAEELAGFVRTEISRRGGTASSATAPVRVPGVATPTALSPYSPSSAAVSDTSASIVKYAAIGLGGVIVASLLYWMYRRSQGRPVFAGGCDLGAADIDDHVRAQWVDNDPYLQKLYQNQSYPLRQFIKRQRAHIDARILDARDGFGAGPSQRDMFYRAGRQRSEADETFLHMVKTGLTASELEKLIAKRPSVWAKYRDWIRILPKRHGVGPDRFKGSLGGLGDTGRSTRKYNAIAQVIGKTRDGWKTSWGLTSVTEIEASSKSEARRAAMAIWRKRGEWPERGKRYDPRSLRLHVTVAEGY